MTHLKLLLSLFILGFVSLVFDYSYAQITSGGFGQSPFERDFGDVKFLDAYFGTLNEKIEIKGGDSNVPFTVVFANVGTQDITGIRGQLSLPFGFSASDGSDSIIRAHSNSNSLAGQNFHLTFFVNIDKNVKIQQYPGTVKLDYSRLRESGVRTAFANFNFQVTGDSVINVKAVDPFLTSLQTNDVVIEISNDGTAPISGVDIIATNTQTELASTTSSTTNIENVILLKTSWSIGNVDPKTAKHFMTTVYVPESLKDETLRIPLSISYYNSQGNLHQIEKIVDFYVKGLIDLAVFNVNVIKLSDTQMVVGEIINEGNEDALFGFVTMDPSGDSNIKSTKQFIDEIEVDAPIPFNIPIKFDGEPRYGKHDITITVRYKDSVRNELFLTHNATIFIQEPPNDDKGDLYSTIIVIPIIITAAVVIYMIRRRKKAKIKAS